MILNCSRFISLLSLKSIFDEFTCFETLTYVDQVEFAEHSHRVQILSMALKRPVKHQTLVSVVRIRLSSFIPFCLLSVMQSCDKMKADASLIIMGPKDTNEVIHWVFFHVVKFCPRVMIGVASGSTQLNYGALTASLSRFKGFLADTTTLWLQSTMHKKTIGSTQDDLL